jgi:RimJ/RimL family protein N-acetyltransferase
MSVPVQLETERLILRHWRSADYAPFAAMCADPIVMEFFPNVLSREESDALADRICALLTQNGWGLWAVEIKETKQFTGYVGLHQPLQTFPFSPCTEVGWRLDQPFWGKGYATEAGKAALKFGFEQLGLAEIVSFTAVLNGRSQAVMQRLGMTNTQQNFEHPALPIGHRLREHVLYRKMAG